MLTKRRRSETLAGLPAISSRQEKAGGLALFQEFECICQRRESRFKIFKLRFLQSNALERLRQRVKDAAQRRIGGQRSEEGLSCDQVRGGVLHLVETKQEDTITFEELATIGTADVADHVRARGKALTSASAASSARFRSGRIDDRNDQVDPLRKGIMELFSCWRHGSELDRSFLLSVMMAKCRVK